MKFAIAMKPDMILNEICYCYEAGYDIKLNLLNLLLL
jgi:hypothetical protein